MCRKCQESALDEEQMSIKKQPFGKRDTITTVKTMRTLKTRTK